VKLSHRAIIPVLVLALVLTAAAAQPPAAPAQAAQAQEKEKEKKQETPPRITEEILVVGRAPADLPVSTVTTLSTTQIDQLKPLDLSEVVKYAPGAMVTVGNKDEFSLKLRGFDNKRIALLVDGVPVIDPYYGSFDLKTVAAGGVESVQVTEGPSSVLYGPNTMGGIVNVISRRPGPEPRVSLAASYGDRSTRSLALDSSYLWKKFGFAATAGYQDSNGYNYRDPTGVELARANSDYGRANLNLKLYYYPTSRSEIMVNGGYYHSDYGMPPDLYGKPRYWRFPNWDRYMLNAGGLTALGERSSLRFRAFYVAYDNSLDFYRDPAMTVRLTRSTFDNADYGVFGIGDFYLAPWNSLKLSIYFQRDKVRTQDDVGLPWTEFDQGTFSGGVEDHVTLTEKWRVIFGASWDYLDKFEGGNTSRLNPLVGLKYSPVESLDLHISYAGKSRFPSMNSLYSPSQGNPYLRSERASTWELGAAYSRGVYLSGAVFATELYDMINSFRLPNGLRTYFNIGEARINGAEIQARKNWSWLMTTVNYTYLDHRNVTDDRPLDVLPDHTLSFELDVRLPAQLRLGVTGVLASKSYWYDNNARQLLTIPDYGYLDVVLSWPLGAVAPFVKLANVFDEYFYTEPGFPWRGRYVEVGLRADVLR
jgi:outer membrane cobalamin receptor